MDPDNFISLAGKLAATANSEVPIDDVRGFVPENDHRAQQSGQQLILR